MLHQLRRKQYTSTWSKKRQRDREEHRDLDGPRPRTRPKKRFPLPIVIDDERAKEEDNPLRRPEEPIRHRLSSLAARDSTATWCFIQEGEPARRKARSASAASISGRPTANMPGLRDVTFALKWGISLIDFKPTLTTANQIKSVTVNGWNRATKKPIKATVTLDDPKLNINRDLHELLKKCDPREELVVDEPVYTQRRRASGPWRSCWIGRRRWSKPARTCVGLPDLRAGQRVNIEGLGARFSGTYFVTETTHTIGDGGYTTKFDARREDKGKGGSA